MDDDWGYPYDFGNLHFAKWSIFTLRRYSPWATRLIEEVFRVQHRQVILRSIGTKHLPNEDPTWSNKRRTKSLKKGIELNNPH